MLVVEARGPAGEPEPALSPLDAEQLAFELGGRVAFLRAWQGVYFARAGEWPPVSPVLRLLRGLYELEPLKARYIARYWIHSSDPPSAACAGAIKVKGRHMRAEVRAAEHGPSGLAGVPRIDAGAAAPPAMRANPGLEAGLSAILRDGPVSADDEGWLALANRVAAAMPNTVASGAEPRVDRPIAALLVGAGGELLGWATNTSSRNSTSHAEVNLVECWLDGARQRLPPGSRIYSTRKPCKMCAGLAWDAASDPWTLRVFYSEDDPLRYARETVLDAGSMARRRVARDSSELAAVLQRRIADPGPRA